MLTGCRGMKRLYAQNGKPLLLLRWNVWQYPEKNLSKLVKILFNDGFPYWFIRIKNWLNFYMEIALNLMLKSLKSVVKGYYFSPS